MEQDELEIECCEYVLALQCIEEKLQKVYENSKDDLDKIQTLFFRNSIEEIIWQALYLIQSMYILDTQTDKDNEYIDKIKESLEQIKKRYRKHYDLDFVFDKCFIDLLFDESFSKACTQTEDLFENYEEI